MQHDNFDASSWLGRWKAAGGGWAAGHLFHVPGSESGAALENLSRELDDHKRAAVARHMLAQMKDA